MYIDVMEEPATSSTRVYQLQAQNKECID